MTIKDLNPKSVWNNFYSLTQVPRPSKHEEKVQQFLLDWGRQNGVETFLDKTGNIIMRKGATPGYENRKGLIMQAHMDMVPQKNADVRHDFVKDPIETQVLGEWVGAKGTTLGADNGIGVAMAMAVMQDKSLKHGPLEALITYDEETGMTGATCLEAGVLKGDILLNLDSETEGELYIGCAGGLDGSADFKYRSYRAPEGYESYALDIKGLQGGHSGMDIVLYRGNANKLAARMLLPMLEKHGVKVSRISGGSLRNAIPFEASVDLLVPGAEVKAIKKIVDTVFSEFKSEFGDTDPNAECHFKKSDKPFERFIQDKVMLAVVRAVMACPNGVDRMSATMPGLVETSNNLASVKSEKGHIYVRSLMRSSVDSAKADLSERMRSLFELAGAEFTTSGAYSGWTPKPETPMIKTMQSVYKAMFGKELTVMAIHAGLECAILGATYPKWDMVSFGPTIVHPHSPDERVKIDTVGKAWDFLVAILENAPVK